MTPSHAAVVIRDGDQVVDGGAVVLIDHVGRHVEAAGGELDGRVEFVPPGGNCIKIGLPGKLIFTYYFKRIGLPKDPFSY